jgi:hypothetical protein
MATNRIPSGDADVICAVMGGDAAAASTVLRADEDVYVFAVERHAALLRALRLPEWGAGAGFNYLSEGEMPSGFPGDALLQTK